MIRDAASLVRTISAAVSTGADIGSTISLEQYNQERYAENNAVIGVCDKLHALYSVQSGPVVWGRSLGLNLVDKLSPVKDMIMKKAAGN
jgi:ubiquinone biosynthesis monooxygenase Coq6